MAHADRNYVYTNRHGWFAIIAGNKHGPFKTARQLCEEHRDWCLEFFFGIKVNSTVEQCQQPPSRARRQA